jgi:hypothetical protein
VDTGSPWLDLCRTIDSHAEGVWSLHAALQTQAHPAWGSAGPLQLLHFLTHALGRHLSEKGLS